MNQLIETEIYAAWFTRLHDIQAKARINARLRRAELGNFGDCKPVDGGVLEMRTHFTDLLYL
jgi:putative addiction module killer protein